MKRRALTALILAVFLPLFCGRPLFAQGDGGFFLGGELDGVILPGSGLGVPVAAKLDFITGYQFNPYFSLNGDLWTVFFVVYGAELSPKFNFTKGRVSPFFAASIGVAGSPLGGDDDDDLSGNIIVPVYSAGPGLDIHFGEHGTLFLAARYHGVIGIVTPPVVALGVGYRWTF